jgi:hypothetical protein
MVQNCQVSLVTAKLCLILMPLMLEQFVLTVLLCYYFMLCAACFAAVCLSGGFVKK